MVNIHLIEPTCNAFDLEAGGDLLKELGAAWSFAEIVERGFVPSHDGYDLKPLHKVALDVDHLLI